MFDHFVGLVFKGLNDLAVLYFPQLRQFQVKVIPILFAYRENFLEKCNKTSSKIYKQLVQQKMQEKVHNIDVFFLLDIIGFK